MNPFRSVGQEVDGAVEIDGDFYLLEARWRQGPSNAGDLLLFQGKVDQRLQNTLGLFIAVNGFAKDAAPGLRTGKQASIVLMSGEDIVYVLEDRIGLVDLLRRKIQVARTTGDIYVAAADLL